MVLRRLIVCLRSGDFIIETAEPDFFAVIPDVDGPFIALLVEMDADETGRGVFTFSPVTHINGLGHSTEIGAAVVEGIAITMVNDKARGRIHKLPVQINYS